MSTRSSSGAVLTRTSVPAADTRAAVLVLHGGSADSPRPVGRLSLAALRLVFVARSVARGIPDAAVYRLRNSVRGWNGDGTAVLSDARWALGRIAKTHPGLPVVLVGHSLGGRVAAHLAQERSPGMHGRERSSAGSEKAVAESGAVAGPGQGGGSGQGADSGRGAGRGSGIHAVATDGPPGAAGTPDAPAVAGAVLLAPWLEPTDPVEGLRGVPIEVVQGTRDRMIPTPSTDAWLTRAGVAGALIRRSVVDGGEHAMVRHRRQWHRLCVEGVARVLDASARPVRTT